MVNDQCTCFHVKNEIIKASWGDMYPFDLQSYLNDPAQRALLRIGCYPNPQFHPVIYSSKE